MAQLLNFDPRDMMALIDELIEMRMREKRRENFNSSSSDLKAVIVSLDPDNFGSMMQQNPNAVPRTRSVGQI